MTHTVLVQNLFLSDTTANSHKAVFIDVSQTLSRLYLGKLIVIPDT